MASSNLEFPRRFRSYKSRESRSINCKIWEVARATTAAPTIFKRISIAEPGQISEDLIDAGIKCNNPIEVVIEEAQLLFGRNRLVGCILSLGTGHPGVIGISKPDTFQNLLPTELIDALKKIATNCEEVAERQNRKFSEFPNVCFRLNVIHGARGISLEEWERMGEVIGHTKAYLQSIAVSRSIDTNVKILCHLQERSTMSVHEAITIGQICTL